jgi:uncharacterized membrane protein YphA (DoxX/SURF4 family)
MVDMSDNLRSPAPLPIRLVFGAYFSVTGFCKLGGLGLYGLELGALSSFLRDCHNNLLWQLHELGVWWPGGVGTGIGLIELFGGLGLFFGAFITMSAALNILSTSFLLLQVLMRGRFPSGGYPVPLHHAFPFGLPEYGFNLLLLGGLATLWLGGAGAHSYDLRRALGVRVLTVIAKIKQGQKQALIQLLKEISEKPFHNEHIHFRQDRLTHFARWFIIENEEIQPLLVWGCTYNGDLEYYIDHVVGLSPGLDKIWGKCEGYSKANGFFWFVRQHRHLAPYTFVAFRDESAETIRAKIAVRERLEQFLDLASVGDYMKDPGVTPFLEDLSRVAYKSPLLVRAARWIAGLLPSVWLYLENNVFPPVINQVAEVYVRLIMPPPPDLVLNTAGLNPGQTMTRAQYLQHLEILERNEQELAAGYGGVRFEQNQVTVVAAIDNKLEVLWAWFTGLFIARAYPPGELTGTRTIHSLHWAVLGPLEYAIIMSNYDGSWPNYLGDFRDQMRWGLDGLLVGVGGYPPGGMSTVYAWEQWFQSARVPCQLFFSGYPEESVENLLRDRAISNALGKDFDLEAVKQWLRHL